jgi:hypothetical protein
MGNRHARGYKETFIKFEESAQQKDTRIPDRRSQSSVMNISIPDTVFWNVTTYSLIGIYRSFGEKYCIHFQDVIKKDGGSMFSETFMNFYRTTRSKTSSIVFIIAAVRSSNLTWNPSYCMKVLAHWFLPIFCSAKSPFKVALFTDIDEVNI